MQDWGHYLSAMTLAVVRLSGMVLLVPFFSSTALPSRAKAAFVLAVAWLLAPLVIEARFDGLLDMAERFVAMHATGHGAGG